MLNKISITSQVAHFGKPYTSKYQRTYELPPPSTIIGILKVIFGEDINNFTFGYSFKYNSKFEDVVTVHKVWLEKIKKINVSRNAKDIPSDWTSREYLYDCKLNIYTDIEKNILMNYILCLGKSNCLARVHFPIVKTNDYENNLSDQYVDVESTEKGIISSFNVFSKYNKEIGMFDAKYKLLKHVKNYKGLYLWKFKDGDICVN